MFIFTSNCDTSIPFSLLQELIPALDEHTGTKWKHSFLTRAVFQRQGRKDESLSEQQDPLKQLRYFTKERVLRGLRYVALDYALRIDEDILVQVHTLPSDPDLAFLQWIANSGSFKVNIDLLRTDGPSPKNLDSGLFKTMISEVRDGVIYSETLAEHLRILLGSGDSWRAKLIANAYLESTDNISPSLTDTLGISYALQGDVGMAKILWELWLTTSPVNEARARYSLAMLQARHNPRSLLNLDVAAQHLESGWHRLLEAEPTPQIEYEKVFNRNGKALILFRQRRYHEARDILKEGISKLQKSQNAGQMHHAVLTSNLARVTHSLGDIDEAERCYRSVITMDPNFSEYHQDLASFLVETGRFEEAQQEAEEALRLDPSPPEAHKMLGFILMHLNNPVDARDEYEIAARLGDSSSVVDMLRASFQAGSAKWLLENISFIENFQFSESDQAEVELLVAQAKSAVDPHMNVMATLHDLSIRFPGDDLIEEAIRLNQPN